MPHRQGTGLLQALLSRNAIGGNEALGMYMQIQQENEDRRRRAQEMMSGLLGQTSEMMNQGMAPQEATQTALTMGQAAGLGPWQTRRLSNLIGQLPTASIWQRPETQEQLTQRMQALMSVPEFAASGPAGLPSRKLIRQALRRELAVTPEEVPNFNEAVNRVYEQLLPPEAYGTYQQVLSGGPVEEQSPDGGFDMGDVLLGGGLLGALGSRRIRRRLFGGAGRGLSGLAGRVTGGRGLSGLASRLPGVGRLLGKRFLPIGLGLLAWEQLMGDDDSGFGIERLR